jgi:hypothetical protein
MVTVTLEVPDELAKKLHTLDPVTLTGVLQRGLAQYEAEQALDTYLPRMQTDDVVAASHKAKERSHAIIEDQGLAAVALLFTDLLAQAVQNTQEKRLARETVVSVS